MNIGDKNWSVPTPLMTEPSDTVTVIVTLDGSTVYDADQTPTWEAADEGMCADYFIATDEIDLSEA